MKRSLVGCVAIAGALAGAAVGAVFQNPSAPPALVQAAPGGESSAAVALADEGNVGLFELEVEPTSVQANGKASSLQYRWHVASRSAKPTRAALAIEVVSDTGQSVQEPVRIGARALAPKGAAGESFSPPANLPDGFYQVRVTAAVAEGKEDQLNVAERYFRVKGGDVVPLSPDEWFSQSAANLPVEL